VTPPEIVYAVARLDDLEALYRSRRDRFERVATAITGDPGLGADAVHDAFVLAVRNRRRFRGEAPLDAWVWRILVNEARKRRAERRRFLPLGDEHEAAAAANGHREGERERALVAALPERQRLTLFLRYYADLDYAAIAAALGVAPGTVAATLNAAHAALRKQLQEVPNA
jgi:RNA polymerase sigma factor (sigma-70 family)